MNNFNFAQYEADINKAIAEIDNNSMARIKATRLQQRTAQKQDKLNPNNLGDPYNAMALAQVGFLDPTINVISSDQIHSIDGDTYSVAGRDNSVRTLGVDTYESTKPNYNEWIKNPNMQAKMAKQRARLSQELGRPATDADVFAAGDAQKKAAQDYTQQPLPSLLQETLLTNGNTLRMKNSNNIVNYGRDAGFLNTLGGKYTKADGTEGDSRQEVLNSNYDQALSDINTYGTNKYAGTSSYNVEDVGHATAQDQGFFDSLMNVPKAAAAGVARSIYDVADTGVEAVGNLAGRAVSVYDEDTGKFLDTADLATDKEKSKQINSGLGYNDTYLRQKMDSANKHYDKAVKEVDLFKPTTWGKIDASELWSSFKDAFSTPEAAGYSMGYLVPALVGVWEKGSIRLMSKVGQKSAMDVAKIAKDTTLSKAAKKTAISDITKNLSLRDKTKLVIADHIDATMYGGAMTNDQLDEVIANNGGEVPTLWDVGWRVALNAAGMKLDMASARAITMGPNPAEALADKLKSMGKTKATKVMAAMTSYAAKLGAAGLTEMPQEYTQSFIEAFSRAYGTDVATGLNGGTRRIGAKEALLSPNTRTQAAQGAIQGFAGGVHMSSPHVGIEALSDATGGKLKEGLDKKIDDLKSVADAPTEDVEAQPDSLAGQMKDLNLEDAKTLFDSAKAELDQGGKDNGISAAEYFQKLPASQQNDFHEANRIYKQKVADEAVATGNTDTLGSVPKEMEDAIISAYASADNEHAPIFEKAMNERTVPGADGYDSDIKGIMKKAKEAREVYQSLSGLDQVRKGVVSEGLDEFKKGFTQYFKEAISYPVGSDERGRATKNLLRFTGLQETKVEKLNNGKQLAINEMGETIHHLMSEANKGNDTKISEADIWQAMVRATSNDGSTLLRDKNTYNDSLKKVLAAGISLDKLDMKGKTKVIDYDSKHYNKMNKGHEGRKPGTFEVNLGGLLVDYANVRNTDNKAISTDNINKTYSTGSSVNKPLDAIAREIEAMHTAIDLIKKNDKRKSEKDTKTSSEAHTKPQEPQTNQEDTTSPEEPKKSSEAADKAKEHVVVQDEDKGLTIADILSLTKEDYLAMHVNEYKAIGKRIGELGINAVKGSQERKDLAESYKLYTKIGTAIKGGKFKGTPLADSINASYKKKPKSKPTVDETAKNVNGNEDHKPPKDARQTKEADYEAAVDEQATKPTTLNKDKVEEDIISIYKLLPPGIQAQIRKKLKGTKGSHATTTIQTKLEDC